MVTKRVIEFTGGQQLRDASGEVPEWWIDTQDPYNGYHSVALQSTPQTVIIPPGDPEEDSPSVAPNDIIEKYEITETPQKLTIDDSFIMYISWSDEMSVLNRQVLGKVEWGWHAKADYNVSTGKWVLDPALSDTKPAGATVVNGVATDIMGCNNGPHKNPYEWNYHP